MGRLPQTNTSVSRFLRQQKRVVTRLANSTPYALSGTSVVAPGLTTVDERLVAGTPGGSRVELDSAGLRKYAADGTTVQVDLTGDVAAFSGLITGSEIIAGTAGAARLELDAAGLRQYAADGTTVLLDTADDATIRARGDNTALGSDAQKALTTGTGNTAVGSLAQRDLTTGYFNTAVGPSAQRDLPTGHDNTAVGPAAQQALTTGNYNTAVGTGAQYFALGNATNKTITAGYQTAIGPFTGQSSPTQVDGITTIGYRAAAGAANATSIGREARADHAGSIALGYQALTTQVDQVMVGPRDVEITDTTKGLVLVSPDATRMRITAADDGSLLVNGESALVPAASETVAGGVELATSAETVTGTDTARAVTPAGVKAATDAASSGQLTPFTFASGWSAYVGGGWNGVHASKVGGRVILGGAIAGPGSFAAGTPILTMNAGWRPPSNIDGFGADGGVPIALMLAANGVFTVETVGGGVIVGNCIYDVA